MKKWLWNTLKTYFTKFFPYMVVFVGSFYNPSDADLGWHLKNGEYFFQNGTILRENIYSTMMSGYQWINSSWATDILTYSVFSKFGFFGLTILAALVVTAAFYFFARAAELSFWEKAFIFPLLIFFEEPLTQVSFRGHLLTLLFLGILYYLLAKYSQGKKLALFFSIPLFIFWSNFHGEFILGLTIFALWIFLFIVKGIIAHQLKLNRDKSAIQRLRRSANLQTIRLILKDNLYLIFIFAISAIAVLVNPFSIGVYLETVKHFGNPLQRFVVEWLPFDTFSILWWKLVIWGVLLLLSTIFLIRRKILTNHLPNLGTVLLLYLLSFWMRRYTWPMLLISIPLIKYFFVEIKPSGKLFSKFLPAMILIIIYFITVIFKNPAMQISQMNWGNYCRWYLSCSSASADFIIRNNLQSKKILTFYNWGGYLIWNYPQIKPSIDGRMHLWRNQAGYSAFLEYYSYEQDWVDVKNTDYELVLISPEKPLYKQMERHVQDKSWSIAFQDQFATVFVRNNIFQ